MVLVMRIDAVVDHCDEFGQAAETVETDSVALRAKSLRWKRRYLDTSSDTGAPLRDGLRSAVK